MLFSEGIVMKQYAAQACNHGNATIITQSTLFTHSNKRCCFTSMITTDYAIGFHSQ